MAPLTSNKAKEDAAIAWVMGVERAAGRQPRDTRYAGASADIESPPRLIEDKSFGTTNRGNDLLMEVRQVEEAWRNPNYYVYVVENVRQGNPAEFTLRVLGGAAAAAVGAGQGIQGLQRSVAGRRLRRLPARSG